MPYYEGGVGAPHIPNLGTSKSYSRSDVINPGKRTPCSQWMRRRVDQDVATMLRSRMPPSAGDSESRRIQSLTHSANTTPLKGQMPRHEGINDDGGTAPLILNNESKQSFALLTL